MIPSADGHVSHLSPQSNDSGNVGNSLTDGRTTYSSQNNIFPQSADIPSSHVEADGSQNEGKRNDAQSAQQEGQPPQPDDIPSDGIGDYYQNPDGYNRSKGFQSDN